MSQENVELYYRAADAFNRRDLEAFLALMHPDIKIESRLVVMEGGYQGHDGVRRWYGSLDAGVHARSGRRAVQLGRNHGRIRRTLQ